MKEKNLIETAKMQGNMMVSGTYLLPDVCVSEPTESDFLWITDLLFGVVGFFFSLKRKRKNSVYFTLCNKKVLIPWYTMIDDMI